jgi:hypothetical protein
MHYHHTCKLGSTKIIHYHQKCKLGSTKYKMRMRFACWITKATDKHFECVILLSHDNNGSAKAPQCCTYTYIVSLVQDNPGNVSNLKAHFRANKGPASRYDNGLLKYSPQSHVLSFKNNFDNENAGLQSCYAFRLENNYRRFKAS